MKEEGFLDSGEDDEQPSDLEEAFIVAGSLMEAKSNEERAGEEMLHNMEIADARLDIEGTSRFGDSWNTATKWAKAGWDWAKRPSETYTEAIGKAALFSAGTTVFLAPVFLYHNCMQVHKAHKEEVGGSKFVQA